jgi:hypothetical protein
MRAYPRASLSARAQRSAAQRSERSAPPPPTPQTERQNNGHEHGRVHPKRRRREIRSYQLFAPVSPPWTCPRRVGEDLLALWAWRSRLLKRS